MNRFHIESFVQIAKLTPARRQIALERIHTRTGALLPEIRRVLLPLVEEALAAQKQALLLIEETRTLKELAMHGSKARETDAKLDRLLTALRDALQVIAATFEPEEAKLASALLEDLLPDGVASFTSKPFIEQHAALRAFLERVRAPETWDVLCKLQLAWWVERLEALNATYGEQLTRPEPRPREALKEADLKGYIAMTQVIAAILGLYPTNAAAHLAARRELLGPIVEQEAEAALLRARRRNGTPSGRPAGGEDSVEDELDDAVAAEDEPPPAPEPELEAAAAAG